MSSSIFLIHQGQYTPFAGSMHFMAWNEANCCRCKKYKPDAEYGDPDACKIEENIAVAGLIDGMVDHATAKAMGYLAATNNDQEEGPEVWPCLEADWEDEHKERCQPHQDKIRAIQAELDKAKEDKAGQ